MKNQIEKLIEQKQTEIVDLRSLLEDQEKIEQRYLALIKEGDEIEVVTKSPSSKSTRLQPTNTGKRTWMGQIQNVFFAHNNKPLPISRIVAGIGGKNPKKSVKNMIYTTINSNRKYLQREGYGVYKLTKHGMNYQQYAR